MELKYLHSFPRSSCAFDANRLKAADRAEKVLHVIIHPACVSGATQIK